MSNNLNEFIKTKMNNFLFRESCLFRGIENLAVATTLTCEVIPELVIVRQFQI